MFDEEGEPHLMDFGLAKQQAGNITVSSAGDIVGTPAYMSPEQAAGDRNIERTSDIYSLGVLLFELLTGELPFRGNSHMLLLQVLNSEPPLPRSLNHQVPRDLEIVCLKAMSKEPHRRYSTAKEFADDLRRFVAHQPVQAKPVSAATRLWLWCQRPERIPEASTITVAMSLMMAVWECQSLLFIGIGLLQIPNRSTAIAAISMGMLFFSVLASLGWLARSRMLAALWIGGVSSIGLLVFALACLLGHVAIPGLTEPNVRVPVFGFFLIAAAFLVATHAVSLLAYYSNQSTMRWSHFRPAESWI